jgi:hypothetical protein
MLNKILGFFRKKKKLAIDFAIDQSNGERIVYSNLMPISMGAITAANQNANTIQIPVTFKFSKVTKIQQKD